MIFRIIKATCKRNRKKILRANYWSSIVGRLISSIYTIIFSVLIYKYIAMSSVNYTFKTYAGTDNYLGYVIIGTVVYSISISGLMAIGRFYMLEIREGTLSSILITPVSRMLFPLGSAVEQMERSIIEIIIIYFICICANIHIGAVSLVEFSILLGALFLTIYAMGSILSYFMLLFKNTYIIQNTFFLLINILCGVSFPIEYLPEQIQFIPKLLPLTYLLQFIRNVMFLNFTVRDCGNIVLKLLLTSGIYWGVGNFLVIRYLAENGDN